MNMRNEWLGFFSHRLEDESGGDEGRKGVKVECRNVYKLVHSFRAKTDRSSDPAKFRKED